MLMAVMFWIGRTGTGRVRLKAGSGSRLQPKKSKKSFNFFNFVG
jgi:membrane protein DedA with SNARE-associated domain